MAEARWQTVAAGVEVEADKVKGTRFVARALPLDPALAPDAAKAAVATARGAHAHAEKHAWAYRVGPDRPDFRWSDDGEPIGSAGASILAKIDALGVLNTLVVVSRWRGPKLAASDLAHGYGEAARAVLAACEVVGFVPTARVALTFDYALSGPVHGVLAHFDAIHESADYAAEVRLVVRVASERMAAFADALRDASAGRALLERL